MRDLGGLHGFTGWNRAFLTDSGGYQVFSLTDLRRLSEDGVSFKSHIDGSAHHLSPERSMEVQMHLGADIVMAFDECPPWPAPREAVAEATARTTRWARRSREAHTRARPVALRHRAGGRPPRPAGAKRPLSSWSSSFPGYAIGGVSVGEPKEDRRRVLECLDPVLPEDRPRYLMGVGTPEDIVEAVARGVDMFDCVLPTRNARNGQLFTRQGRLSIRNARFRDDPRPPDPDCGCPTCRTVSRAYLRHLHTAGEISAATLMTVHNLFFYLDMMRSMRQSIRSCRFEEFRLDLLRSLGGARRAAPRACREGLKRLPRENEPPNERSNPAPCVRGLALRRGEPDGQLRPDGRPLRHLLVRPHSAHAKKQKKLEELVKGLKAGDRVVLSSGILGSIAAVEDDTFLVRIDDKTKIKVLKSAVAGLQGSTSETEQK